MINEWTKVVNAIMIFDTFDWGVLLCVLAFMYFWALSTKRHFHLRWKRSYISWNFASKSALSPYICPEKLKTRTRASWWTFIKSQDSDWIRIDKGIVYPNVYCNITAWTTVNSNLSNTVIYDEASAAAWPFCFFFFFPPEKWCLYIAWPFGSRELVRCYQTSHRHRGARNVLPTDAKRAVGLIAAL